MSFHKKKFPLRSFFSHPLTQAFFQRVLFVKKEKDFSVWLTKLLFYLILVIWGLSFFDETHFDVDQYGAMDSFLHYIHLPFHEAGHIIFNPFGEFMGYLGGSLMQCLVPVAIIIYFVREKDNFSASFGLWWLGHSFLDIAPYIYDAWDQTLILLGGGTGRDQPGAHDWRWLLSTMGQLKNYKEIALFTANMGKGILFLSFLWGGTLLGKKFWLKISSKPYTKSLP